jgi:hypothetical protein
MVENHLGQQQQQRSMLSRLASIPHPALGALFLPTRDSGIILALCTWHHPQCPSLVGRMRQQWGTVICPVQNCGSKGQTQWLMGYDGGIGHVQICHGVEIREAAAADAGRQPQIQSYCDFLQSSRAQASNRTGQEVRPAPLFPSSGPTRMTHRILATGSSNSQNPPVLGSRSSQARPVAGLSNSRRTPVGQPGSSRQVPVNQSTSTRQPVPTGPSCPRPSPAQSSSSHQQPAVRSSFPHRPPTAGPSCPRR